MGAGDRKYPPSSFDYRCRLVVGTSWLRLWGQRAKREPGESASCVNPHPLRDSHPRRGASSATAGAQSAPLKEARSKSLPRSLNAAPADKAGAAAGSDARRAQSMAVRNSGEGKEDGLRAKLLLASGVQASDVQSDGSSKAMVRSSTAATAVADAGSQAAPSSSSGAAGGGMPRRHSKAVSFVSNATAVARSDVGDVAGDTAAQLHVQPPSGEAPAAHPARGKGALKGILRGIGFGLGLKGKAGGDAAAGGPDSAGTALRSLSSESDADVESGPYPVGQVTPRYGTPGTPDHQEGSPASPVPQPQPQRQQGPVTPTTSRATEGVAGSIPFRIISPASAAASTSTLSSSTSTSSRSAEPGDKALKDGNSGQVVSPFSVMAGSSFGVESSANGGMGGRAMSAAASGALAAQAPPWLERIFSYLSLSTDTDDQQVGQVRVGKRGHAERHGRFGGRAGTYRQRARSPCPHAIMCDRPTCCCRRTPRTSR